MGAVLKLIASLITAQKFGICIIICYLVPKQYFSSSSGYEKQAVSQ